MTKVWSPETSGRRPSPLRQERREIFSTQWCLSSGIHTSTAKAHRGIPARLLWDKFCGRTLSGRPTHTHHALRRDTHVTRARSHTGNPLPYSEKKKCQTDFFFLSRNHSSPKLKKLESTKAEWFSWISSAQLDWSEVDNLVAQLGWCFLPFFVLWEETELKADFLG